MSRFFARSDALWNLEYKNPYAIPDTAAAFRRGVCTTAGKETQSRASPEPATLAAVRSAGPNVRVPYRLRCPVWVLSHARGDYASDDNPNKAIARRMITLTRQINAELGGDEVHVTCFTCHRGAQMPLTAPAQ